MDGEAVTEKRKTTCRTCGTVFEYEPVFFDGREFAGKYHCDPCIVKSEAEHQSSVEEAHRSSRQSDWESVCPPLYRDTDPARISQECVKLATSWDWKTKKGIGMIGETGRGKTRALFLALKRAHDAGLSCAACSHSVFSRIVMLGFSGKEDSRRLNMEKLESLRSSSILLLDDIGKAPSTERSDAELEELIEYRTSHMKPILWSANASSAWLEQRLGPDRGAPLVRRLSEFSTVITA